MTKICPLPYRSLIKIFGSDSHKFLNGLVTAKIEMSPENQLVYGAFLKPQGKIITDCLFWIRSLNEVWLDIATAQSDALVRSLNMYKLRADVRILKDNTTVNAVFNIDTKIHYLNDPRANIVGSSPFGRSYEPILNNTNPLEWAHFRFNHCITESGYDFEADKLYATDANLDLMHGIDFHKGCYVGQELTSRMKRRGQIKNRLMTIRSHMELQDNAEIIQNDQVIGNVMKYQQNNGLGLIRIDRLNPQEKTFCNDIEIEIYEQPWQMP